MSKHLKRDVEALEQELLEMSSRVEGMIRQACEAFINKDVEGVEVVLEAEALIDTKEVEIEEDCLKILALHQPVASDLRRVTTVMKINNELERIADLAVNICERAAALAQRPEVQIPAVLTRMSDAAVQLVRGALDAFVKEDVAAAWSIMQGDDDVDRMNREVIEELQEVMHRDPSIIPAALHCFSAARHIERIADHSTNIAEDIVYLVEGEIARHKHDMTDNLAQDEDS